MFVARHIQGAPWEADALKIMTNSWRQRSRRLKRDAAVRRTLLYRAQVSMVPMNAHVDFSSLPPGPRARFGLPSIGDGRPSRSVAIHRRQKEPAPLETSDVEQPIDTGTAAGKCFLGSACSPKFETNLRRDPPLPARCGAVRSEPQPAVLNRYQPNSGMRARTVANRWSSWTRSRVQCGGDCSLAKHRSEANGRERPHWLLRTGRWAPIRPCAKHWDSSGAVLVGRAGERVSIVA